MHRTLSRPPCIDSMLARIHLPSVFTCRDWLLRFSPSSAKRVYGLYLQLDIDGNGMLSQQELLQYDGAYLTEVLGHARPVDHTKAHTNKQTNKQTNKHRHKTISSDLEEII